MTTFAEIEAKIDPMTLSHSKWLSAFSKRTDLDIEARKRLHEIACLLLYRPDIDMRGDFQFEVGKTYPTRGGKLVTIVNKTADKGYECVQGDDMTRRSGYRYCRSTDTVDHGRCTGSKGDEPTNLLPIEITDPRITGAKPFEERKLLVLSTAHITKETAEKLNVVESRDWPFPGGPYGEYGWFMYACDDDPNRKDYWKIPADLRRVMDFARQNGFSNILLDRDADRVEGLPTWDW